MNHATIVAIVMTKNRTDSLWYSIPEFGDVEFTRPVLAHLKKYQQKCKWSREAGGQLFWQYASEGHKRVAVITGPRSTDKRTRTSYKADHVKEQIEIDEYYEKGYFLLGDWHTHPESIASPSSEDRKAIRDIYRSSVNPGPGFVLLIVGTRPLHESLSVSWCNDNITAVERLNK